MVTFYLPKSEQEYVINKLKLASYAAIYVIHRSKMSLQGIKVFCSKWSHGTKYAILEGKLTIIPPLGNPNQGNVKLDWSKSL